MIDVMDHVNYDTFMQKFLPVPSPTDTQRQQFVLFKEKSVRSTEEFDAYPALCESIQSALDAAAAASPNSTHLLIRDTASWPDTHDVTSRPDLSIYPTLPHVLESITLTKKDTKDKKTADGARGPYIARTRWPFLASTVEVKSKASESAFIFNPQNPEEFLRRTDDGLKALGQLVEHPMLMFARQHLTYVFSVSTFQQYARIVRWDRSGAIATDAFDFCGQNSYKLLDFFFRLGCMSDEQRGYDPTAVLASDTELVQLEQARGAFSAVQRRLYDEMMAEGRRPIYKITVRAEDLIPPERLRPAGGASQTTSSSVVSPPNAGQGIRSFLVGKERFASGSAVGRGTKGYVAFDLLERRFVFLKDSWRTGARAEHTVYESLWRANVTHIATPISGGDVYSGNVAQKTSNHECGEGFPIRTHYRLIVREVGRPLEDYKDAAYLVKYIYDAMTAHQEAWESAGILHRDVSGENILIYEPQTDADPSSEEPLAFLNDWDLCKSRQEMNKISQDHIHSGTWQFMSALLLTNPAKKHELSDDLESFVHVLYWLSLKYHEHSWTGEPAALRIHMFRYFDDRIRRTTDSRYHGGDYKLVTMKSGEPLCTLQGNAPFQSFLRSLAKLCQAHYAYVEATRPPRAEDTKPLKKEDLTDIPQWSFVRRFPRKESSTSASVSTGPPPAYTPFESHEAIIVAFEEVIPTLPTWPKGKTEDQWASFTTYGRGHIDDYGSATGSRSKRSSQESASQRAKKARRENGDETTTSAGTPLPPIDERAR
ncbi:hypothetical protein WOLCODRAFT_136166 [Wolfiporia cocos MD-104 SS10]|uniref:Fungal-type protein kinase domain-containing protein n=1 Tax=Wolfiporia cocos (strain MD-104) TaxID=742152 RepID=A0A2H3JHT2_WOLCO|nr:hypothetical protein WOLCODRAFT_136166 [Wolfiporia cocos MD-104 SS10]